MKTLIITAVVIGGAWLTFTNHLDEKRMEAYEGCVMVENYNGDYQCIK